MNQPAGPAWPESPELSWSELADAVWLAGHVRLPAASDAEPATSGQRDDLRAAAAPPDDHLDPPPPPMPEPAGTAPAPDLGSAPRSPAVDGGRVHRGGPGLTGRLSITRALRVFDEVGTSRAEAVLDAEGTAITAAETGLWLPRLTTAFQRRLEVVVLMDESASMALWARTVRDFRILLERQGAFANVRTVSLDGDDGAGEGYRDAAGTTRHRFAELASPADRRIFLVLTDGVGSAWREGTFAPALDRLARTGPLAVVNVLPQRLWPRTHLVVRPLVLRAPAPVTPNHLLTNTRPGRANTALTGLPVPVLELDSRWLGKWGKLTTAREAVRLPALLLGAPPDGSGDFDEPDPEPGISAREQVLKFRAASSAPAFRLAVLFAAAPLNLPVMQLIQRTVLPEAPYSALAEVVLGGLLTRVGHRATGDPYAVEFDFPAGVRAELLAAGQRRTTARVVRIVSAHFGPGIPAIRNADEMLRSPESFRLPGDDPVGEPYREVVRSVMTALGVAQLRPARRAARASTPASSSSGASDRPMAIRGGVPAQDAAFTGRADVLSALDTALGDGSTVSVLGAEGTGKSALVAEYVHRHRGAYDLVWWIRAREEAQVVASYAALARRLGVAGADDGARAAMAAARTALRHLAEPDRVLLIFDDAGLPDRIRPLLPENGHVILTSRASAWSADTTVLHCPGLSRDEGRNLIEELVPGEGDLADELGGRPAVLRHAAAVLRGCGIPVGEYRARLREKRARVSADEPPNDTAAWEVAFDHLRRREPEAIRLAETYAFFADGAVPAAVRRAAEELLPVREAAAARALERHGFARIDPDTGALEFSSLVRKALCDQPAARGEQVQRTAHRLLAAAWHESAGRRPDACDIVGHLRAGHAVDSAEPEIRELVLDVAAALVAAGDPPSAVELCRETRARWEHRLGPDHVDTFAAGLALATSLYAAGDTESALGLDAAAAQRSAQVLGPDHPVTLAATLNQALDLAALGRHGESARLHATAVAACDRVAGPDHPMSRSARRHERSGHRPSSAGHPGQAGG